jgi:prepilin-type N-terminal cleavage/methylation domain-containing protein
MSRGFTLIELVIAIVVVAIAAVAIGSAFAYDALAGAERTGAFRIAQECAEHIIGPGAARSYAAVARWRRIYCLHSRRDQRRFTRTVNITNAAGAGTGFAPPAGRRRDCRAARSRWFAPPMLTNY